MTYDWNKLVARVYAIAGVDESEFSPRPWETDDRLTFYAWRTAIEEIVTPRIVEYAMNTTGMTSDEIDLAHREGK